MDASTWIVCALLYLIVGVLSGVMLVWSGGMDFRWWLIPLVTVAWLPMSVACMVMIVDDEFRIWRRTRHR